MGGYQADMKKVIVLLAILSTLAIFIALRPDGEPTTDTQKNTLTKITTLSISKKLNFEEATVTAGAVTMPIKEGSSKIDTEQGNIESLMTGDEEWSKTIDRINSVLRPEFELTCGTGQNSSMDNLSILSDLLFIFRSDIPALKAFVDLYMAKEKNSDICVDDEFTKKLKDIFASKTYGNLVSVLRKNGRGDDDYILTLEREWSK